MHTVYSWEYDLFNISLEEENRVFGSLDLFKE